MISAAEALLLHRARISPSDAEAVRDYLAEVDAYVREHATRVGCVMPVDPARMNPVIAAEVERALRAAGWRAEFQQAVVRSQLQPGQKVASFQLALAPSDAACEEADRRLRAEREN